jgi:cytochrome b561
MALRNGRHGYGLVTKVLHWLTVALLAAQFTVGYTMSDDRRHGGRGGHHGAGCDLDGGGRQSDAEKERLDRLEEECEQRQDALDARGHDEPVATALDDLAAGRVLADGVTLPEWHVLLGLAIIALGLVRLLWRRTTPLPPWAPGLGPAGRRIEAGVEKVLLALLLAVPGTGLLLALGEDDWLPLHIAAHVALFGALGVHVGLVLWHTVVRRERHLARML